MASAAANLEPPYLVELALTRPSTEFVAAIGAPILLVRVGDRTGDLAAALADIATGTGTRLEPTFGYETVTEGESVDVRIRRARLARGAFGSAQIQVRLIRDLHFALPLRKRVGAGKSFSARISMGRARNNDVVLRHESVSKFHAWFGCDDEGAFYIADASSHNGTFINGEPLVSGAPTRLSPGDTLHIGSVEAVVCPADALWSALQAGR